jgi:ABC-type transport system involved in multi-copper enzyme maturation permease subunit
MRWLVWKELGQNRPIMIAGGILLIVPHLVALTGTLLFGEPSMPRMPDAFVLSAAYSILLSQLTLALLGGNAIASERADRSAEFLFYLPLSRTRIFTGKMTLAITVALLIWSVNLLILHLTFPYIWRSEVGGAVVIRRMLLGAVLTGSVMYSVGWLLSTRWETPTFPICGGLAAPFVVLLGILAATWAWEYPFHEVAWPWYQRVCPGVAVVSFLAGTWYYLRRVEP